MKKDEFDSLYSELLWLGFLWNVNSTHNHKFSFFLNSKLNVNIDVELRDYAGATCFEAFGWGIFLLILFRLMKTQFQRRDFKPCLTYFHVLI